jgi:hypothetical protein
VAGEPLDIALIQRDERVRAAISGTFLTVILCGAHARSSPAVFRPPWDRYVVGSSAGRPTPLDSCNAPWGKSKGDDGLDPHAEDRVAGDVTLSPITSAFLAASS